MIVPESRPIIYDIVKRVLEDAIEQGVFLYRPRETPIADRIYYDLLIPALDDLPGREDVVRRCFIVVRRILELKNSYFDDVMALEIMGPLRDRGYGSVVRRIDPDLDRIAQNRWPLWRESKDD